MRSPLIDVATLIAWRQESDPPLVIVDCRADLADPDAGRRAWLNGHIPGAVFADLEHDMSGPPVTNRGRHPLPTDSALSAFLGQLGITRASRVVAYDAHGGAFAARFWWLARYAGVESAHVLNGGLAAWSKEIGALELGIHENRTREFGEVAMAMPVLTLAELDPAVSVLLDAREARRYRGEFEPIDPVAGHIPGAFNHPFVNNLDEEGCFKSSAQLKAGFEAALGRTPDADTVHYCGSGVTACHNILAQVAAGLPVPYLYAGSFSEWCNTDGCEVETGPGPGPA